MYNTIYIGELKELVKSATIFIQNSNSEAEYDYVKACYNPANALAGYTDYKDHRKDTLPQVKKMIKEEIKTRQCQRGSYYNDKGIPFDSIRVVLKNGGWSAYPCWSDGTLDFFSSKYVKK